MAGHTPESGITTRQDDALCAGSEIANIGHPPESAGAGQRPFTRSLDYSVRSAFVVDWSLKIIYMNQAFEHLTGFHGKDLDLRRVRFKVHPDDQEETESCVIMAIVGRTTVSRCRVRGPKGAYHPMALRFCPLRLGDRMLVLCVDTGRLPTRRAQGRRGARAGSAAFGRPPRPPAATGDFI